MSLTAAAARLKQAKSLYQANNHKIIFRYRYNQLNWNPGYFITIGRVPNGTWYEIERYTCREDFHRMGIRRRFLFGNSDFQGPAIALFMRRFEEQVHARPYSTFAATERPCLTWVEMSSWWAQEPMRRSLFTALLRAANGYRPAEERDDFERALFAYPYIGHTADAVRLFMSGRTHYTGHVCGWTNQFARYTQLRASLQYIYRNARPLTELLVRP